MFATSICIHAQTGGGFTITQSVVASGGSDAANGNFALNATIGQPPIGGIPRRAPFAITSGYWNFTPTAPTAASVSISGQVRTANGNGLRNAVLTLTAPTGSTKTARSTSFGYFRFDDILVGETYVLSIAARRYRFSQSSIVVSLFDEIAGLDFTADPVP